MRKNQFWPCVVVAGDTLAPVSLRGAVFVITILLWIGICLVGKELLPTFLAVLAGAGTTIDFGVRGSLTLHWDLRLSTAHDDGPVITE